MRYWLIPLSSLALVAALAGCGDEDASSGGPASVSAPVPVVGGTPAPGPSGSAGGGSSGGSSPATPTAGASSPPNASTPTATLEVASDGCGVIRSEVTGGTARSLTWSVKDAGGFEVLGRNAQAETRYRYFRPGEYTVVLTAFLDGGYRPISNPVSIRC